MYCGHLGIGLGVKGCRGTIPLGLLLLAAYGCDWVEVGCLLLHVPHTAMVSHSVPAVVVITAVLAGIAWGVCRSWKDSAVVGAVALSHIAVDWITGRKPSWPGGAYWGAHLYRYPAADFALEITFVIVGWMLYRRALAPSVRNHFALIALLILLVSLQGVFDLKYAS